VDLRPPLARAAEDLRDLRGVFEPVRFDLAMGFSEMSLHKSNACATQADHPDRR
jgi:hypothetical protein